MWPNRALLDLLGIEHPIIQAPMAGGPTTPELVAAVSNAGGLGSLGAAYLRPPALREAIAAIRRLTDRPFNVNLFVPEPAPPARAEVEAAAAALQPFHDELGLGPVVVPESWAEFFDEQLAVLIEEKVPVFSFTFGMPAPEAVASARKAGIAVLGTATTAREGTLLEDLGVSAVVAQGSEAGGHRGSFAVPYEDAMIGLMALVPRMADLLRVPVVAAGGIMDARGMLAAFALGAAGVQMGTAFLPCPESGAHPEHKRILMSAADSDMAVTRAFSGKPARGVRNRFMVEIGEGGDRIAGYPAQNALTRPLRTAAAGAGRAEFLSLWAGQAAALARPLPAGALVGKLAADVRALQARLAGSAS